jgi:hypothetical protein
MSATKNKRIGADAVAEKGWLGAHKWLILRRISQFSILALFLVGPWFGQWIVKGNLAYSYTSAFCRSLTLTLPCNRWSPAICRKRWA